MSQTPNPSPPEDTPPPGLAIGSEEESLITEGDLRSVVRLLTEVIRDERDLASRKRTLMEGLARLVDADSWLWTITRDVREGGRPLSIWMMHGGLSKDQVAAMVAYANDPVGPPPEHAPLARLQQEGRHYTRRRQQLISDEDFYNAGSIRQYGKLMNMDQYVFSIYPLEEPDMISGVGLHRQWGREPFSERESRLMHIVCSEIRWLHSTDMPKDRGHESLGLSPRQRTVFMMLLQGTSPKDMASNLSLSVHTVNDHIKAIYRQFKVGSRHELAARFINGDGGDHSPASNTP